MRIITTSNMSGRCLNVRSSKTRDAKKHVFFQTMFFMQKKKCFFIEKKQFYNVFFCFFSITGRFLINYSAICVYL